MKHIKAVIFDWAGTAVDHGSLCPVFAFQKTLEQEMISVTRREILQFMGVSKREHLRKIMALPSVGEQWRRLHPQTPSPSELDIDRLYSLSESIIMKTVTDFSDPLPGLIQTVDWIRSEKVRVGSTTGYTRAMMEKLVPVAAQKGYSPDFWIASDQVAEGRPAPDMIHRVMEALRVYPPHSLVKVGDAQVDMAEGKNAGAWAVGVIATSSLIGLGEAEWNALNETEHNQLASEAKKAFESAGADLTILSLHELPLALMKIDQWLSEGKSPGTLL